MTQQENYYISPLRSAFDILKRAQEEMNGQRFKVAGDLFGNAGSLMADFKRKLNPG